MNVWRMAIPMQWTQERGHSRRRRSSDDGERAVEAYFAVLTILILGMIIGIAAFAVLRVIPEWQRLHSLDRMNHNRFEFESHSSELK